MSIFEIQNYTRYNTEDIEALLAALEGVLFGSGDTVQSWAGKTPLLGEKEVLEIRTYSPVQVEDHSGRRNCVKEAVSYRRSSVVRIILPERLFSSPVEALSTAGDEYALATQEALNQLCQRLALLYTVSGRTWRDKTDLRGRAVTAAQGGRLRFGTKPGRKETEEDKRRRVARLLAKKAGNLRYNLHGSGHALYKRADGAATAAYRLSERAKKAGLIDEQGVAEEIFDLVRDAKEKLEKAGQLSVDLYNSLPR
jgi:hypothetical protein